MTIHPGPILAVEDVPDTLQLVDVALRFKGYRVVTARNGREALKAIEAERPSLIITDILMPGMDGFSLVNRLRIQPDTRDIPVVFLSATYVAPEDKEFASAIGVSRFLEKPINIEEMLKTVSELLKEKTHPRQPMNQRAFYEGYRKRLEEKLGQKVTQIARTEGMLDTLSDEERKSFEASMKQFIEERDEIQLLLEQIHRLETGDLK
jgi:CheY-like chemotaxis protein